MARIKAQFKAGDIVKVKDDVFEDDFEYGVGRFKKDYVYANYHVTAEDTERWYEEKRKATEEAMAAGEDTFSINFDDAGESRLPPRGGRTKLFRGTGYRVLRARCRESFSYYNPTGGWTKLLDLNTGREVFIKMTKLEKVTA